MTSLVMSYSNQVNINIYADLSTKIATVTNNKRLDRVISVKIPSTNLFENYLFLKVSTNTAPTITNPITNC